MTLNRSRSCEGAILSQQERKDSEKKKEPEHWKNGEKTGGKGIYCQGKSCILGKVRSGLCRSCLKRGEIKTGGGIKSNPSAMGRGELTLYQLKGERREKTMCAKEQLMHGDDLEHKGGAVGIGKRPRAIWGKMERV